MKTKFVIVMAVTFLFAFNAFAQNGGKAEGFAEAGSQQQI